VTPTFRRVAVAAATLTAIVGVFYTVTFALFVRRGYHWAHWASASALLVSGLLAAPVLVGLHALFRDREPEFAGTALIVGVVGALGATIHGGFDVAALAHPFSATADAPSQVDPRGLLAFAFTGVGLALFGWLALHTQRLPARSGQTGLVAGALLVVVYLGRLIALDPNTTVVRVAALASGLLAVPGFYLQVARALAREPQRTSR
jgi:hypothetical protein